MYARLAKVVTNGQEENDDLPETLDITQEEIDKYYLIWAWWAATGKRHKISDILNEPSEAMTTVLEIDNIYNKIAHQLSKKDEEDLQE